MHRLYPTLLALIASLFTVGLSAPACAGQLAVTIDFPGGSGEVSKIDQERRLIVLQPSAIKDRGWACWWYVRIDGLTPGESLLVDVGDAPWATPDRAALSDDQKVWRQTERGQRAGKRIVYKVNATGCTLWLAWGPPFVQADGETLVKSIAKKDAGAKAFELCRSKDDRPVWALRLSPPDKPAGSEPLLGIWIQARQHAWESGSSYVAEGLTQWLTSSDDRAQHLRRIAEITIVPIMDVDNVERGAGGKNETPHDHNRDWTDKPHHPAVAAAQKNIRELNKQGAFDLFIDLHNPDASSQHPFFFATPRSLLSPQGARNLEHWLATAKVEMVGPLAFRGEVQESGDKYDKQWQAISKNWVTFHTAEHVVAVTLETSWNTPDSTADGYRSVGRNLGLTMERYLRQSPRKAVAE